MTESTATGPEIAGAYVWTPSLSSEATPQTQDLAEPLRPRRGFLPVARSAAIGIALAAAVPITEITATAWGRRKLQTAISQVAIAGEESILPAIMDVESILVIDYKRPTLWLTDYIVPLLPNRKPFIVLFDDEDE